MTKPISRKMAVDCLLDRFSYHDGWTQIGKDGSRGLYLACGICYGIIEAGDDIQFDHIHAHVFDGPHEYKNLRPVHAECHKLKTAADIAANAKVKRIIKKTSGEGKKKRTWPKSRSLQSRPFPKVKRGFKVRKPERRPEMP